MTVTAAQIRAGRGLVHWTAKDLADRIGITPSSMSAIENEQSKGSVQTLLAIEAALTGAGVEFIADGGVRPLQTRIIHYQGAEGFRRFMDDVYETARDVGGEIVLHNAKPTYWDKWLGADWHKMHIPRMLAVKDRYTLKITCAEKEDMQETRTYAEYRWIPSHMYNDRAFYCYGPKLAFLNFTPDNVHIYVLNQQEFADGFRGIFNIAWEQVAEKPKKKS